MRTAALVLAAVISSSATENERALQLLHQWIAAADQHIAGEGDVPLASVSDWTYDELEAMRAYVQALIELPLTKDERRARRAKLTARDGAVIKELAKTMHGRGDFDSFRKRAAILHTDAALLAPIPRVVDASIAPPPARRRGEPGPEVQVSSLDGRVDHFEATNPHWHYAMDLLESVTAGPDRDAIVAQWYRTVGAYFVRERRFADALTHFGRAHEIVPNDPDVLYGEASLQEALGAPRVQDYVRVTTLPNGLSIRGVSSPRAHHRKAEELLRRALVARPDFVAAHLRLGRVLVEQTNYEEALAHFRQVIDSAHDRTLTYYAYLFTGDAALAMGRAADAQAAYRQAIGLYPQTQAAHLGLGAALRMSGERPAALDAVLSTLTQAADFRDAEDEPWWVYYEGDAANVGQLLEELRRRFREAVK